MSIILQLGPKYENLVDILDRYETDLEGYEKNLSISGKTIEHALKEQAGWTAYYAQRRVELKTLVTYLEQQIKKVRSQLYVQYNENYNPRLGERAIDKYIDREPEYLNLADLHAESVEVLNKYEMLLDAFTKRGYALKDIANCRVHAVHESVL